MTIPRNMQIIAEVGHYWAAYDQGRLAHSVGMKREENPWDTDLSRTHVNCPDLVSGLGRRGGTLMASEIEGWQPDLFDDVETDGWALMHEDECPHEWSYTGSAYGGDDTRWHGEGRCYCVLCGADGDA